ncbi:MAG TPA: CHRD domain-containing protein [Allosphingosinicella sp.]|nr:CHRD domain-containing protein [Allosphingosinicella sp.]
MRHKAALALASTGMIAMLGGCETVAEEANEAVGFEYVAMLAPSGGGAAAGKAEISLNDATNTLCTDLELSGVTMTVGHIVGPGDTVIATLDVPKDNDSDDCDAVTDAQLDAIKANPGDFKVHVGTTTGDLYGTLVKEG